MHSLQSRFVPCLIFHTNHSVDVDPMSPRIPIASQDTCGKSPRTDDMRYWRRRPALELCQPLGVKCSAKSPVFSALHNFQGRIPQWRQLRQCSPSFTQWAVEDPNMVSPSSFRHEQSTQGSVASHAFGGAVDYVDSDHPGSPHFPALQLANLGQAGSTQPAEGIVRSRKQRYHLQNRSSGTDCSRNVPQFALTTCAHRFVQF